MDKGKLKNELEGFVSECGKQGYPLTYIGLKEAYPGIDGSSYFVEIKAPWTSNMTCLDALRRLFKILWETTSEITRTSVFAIKILDSDMEVK